MGDWQVVYEDGIAARAYWRYETNEYRPEERPRRSLLPGCAEWRDRMNQRLNDDAAPSARGDLREGI